MPRDPEAAERRLPPDAPSVASPFVLAVRSTFFVAPKHTKPISYIRLSSLLGETRQANPSRAFAFPGGLSFDTVGRLTLRVD